MQAQEHNTIIKHNSLMAHLLAPLHVPLYCPNDGISQMCFFFFRGFLSGLAEREERTFELLSRG